MTKELFLFLILVLLPQELCGQMIGGMHAKRPQPQIVWDNERLVIIEKLGTSIKWVAKDGKSFMTRQSPAGCLGLSVFRGAISYVTIKEGSGFLYTRYSEETGPEVCKIDTNHPEGERGFPMSLYECDSPGLFFAINVETGFVKRDEASCCSWWRKRPDGQLELDSIIPIELFNSAFVGVRNNGRYERAQISPANRGLVPFLDYPIRVPGAFIVVSWKLGVLWVLKDGSPFTTRTIELISADREMVSGRRVSPPVILGIQPMPNGHLLVARQSDASVMISQEAKVIHDKDAIVSDPEIKWIEVDPMTGKIEKPDSRLIADAPTSLKTEGDVMRFTFGFNPNGSLVYPWVSPPIEERAKNNPRKDNPAETAPRLEAPK